MSNSAFRCDENGNVIDIVTVAPNYVNIFQLTMYTYKLFELRKKCMCVSYYICNVGSDPFGRINYLIFTLC